MQSDIINPILSCILVLLIIILYSWLASEMH